SLLLVLVVFATNAFLIAFAADAVLSLLADGTGMAPDAFLGVRTTVGLIASFFGIVALFAVIFVPQLPKSVLVPPLVIILWEVFGAPPFAWSFTDRSTWVPIDIVQLLVAAGAFLIARARTGGWLLAASRLPRKGHLLLRTLIAIPVAVVV